MKTYEPKYSAHTSCATFPYLILRPVETMDDYHLRAQLAYKMLYDSKPAAVLAMTAAAAKADLWENLRKKFLRPKRMHSFRAWTSLGSWKPSNRIIATLKILLPSELRCCQRWPEPQHVSTSQRRRLIRSLPYRL
jgi:hypothetical protein